MQGKALVKSLKRAATGSGWRCSSGTLFRQYGVWFVEVQSVIWLARRRTTVEMHVKPMALDPLFWEIVELPDNVRLPLSFRSNGAWTCRTPPLAGEDIAERELDPDHLAIEALTWSNRRLSVLKTLSVDAFLTIVRRAPHGHPGAYFATEFTTLALLGRFDEANSLCGAGRSRSDGGGFGIGTKSFIDVAETWLARRLTARST